MCGNSWIEIGARHVRFCYVAIAWILLVSESLSETGIGVSLTNYHSPMNQVVLYRSPATL